MSTFAICYDLDSPGQDYSELHKAIKGLGAWWHHLDSTWLVTSSKAASDIRDDLKAFLDANDELLVIDITGSGWATTGFNKGTSDWLRKHVSG